MKGLLLTGATGFVGRNLLLSELSSGRRIFAPVRDVSKLQMQLEREGANEKLVSPLPTNPSKWPSIEVDRAVLCAGVLFARSEEEYIQTNVEWAARVLEALPPECETIVLSSQAAGGPTPKGAVARTESHNDSPITWYGRSKLALEEMLVERFPHRNLKVLRPPMVLGARDSATLPLFKMAASLLRVKPGMRLKEYSFISVDDLVAGIAAVWGTPPAPPRYIAAARSITDMELIETAAKSMGRHGVTIPIPQIIVKFLSRIVDMVPALRASAPSLTRDRARDIWPDRWVVDSGMFREATGWACTVGLEQAIDSAREFYRCHGLVG